MITTCIQNKNFTPLIKRDNSQNTVVQNGVRRNKRKICGRVEAEQKRKLSGISTRSG